MKKSTSKKCGKQSITPRVARRRYIPMALKVSVVMGESSVDVCASAQYPVYAHVLNNMAVEDLKTLLVMLHEATSEAVTELASRGG